MDFVCVARDWAMDRPNFEKSILRIADPIHQPTPWYLLIFPESTVLHDRAILKMHEYAEKMGLAPNKHTLLPRETGIKRALELLKAKKIIDLTLAYEGAKVQEDPEDTFTIWKMLIEGQAPPFVHIAARCLSDIPLEEEEEKFVKEISGETVIRPKIKSKREEPRTKFVYAPMESKLPSTEVKGKVSKFGLWLDKRFKEKDALMELFYKGKPWTGPEAQKVCSSELIGPFEVPMVENRNLWLLGNMALVLIVWYLIINHAFGKFGLF